MTLKRRRFLSLTTAGATLLWWQPPGGWSRRGNAAPMDQPPRRYRPTAALAAYSLRQHFRWSRGKPQQPAEPAIDMYGFIDFCAQHDVAAELTSYFFPPELDDRELLKIKRYAFLSGVSICGTAIGNRFDELKGDALEQDIRNAERWIDRTALLGAGHIRLFAGKARTLAEPERFAQSVAATRRCAQYAAKRGVMIGIENHGGITAQTLLRFLDQVDSPWIGINLDTGNFQAAPYQQIQQCVDRAVHVQWKVTYRDPQGNRIGLDYARVASILQDANYSGFVALEYEEDGDPREQSAKEIRRMRSALQGFE